MQYEPEFIYFHVWLVVWFSFTNGLRRTGLPLCDRQRPGTK
jgi:hypothetical protein